MTRQKKFVLVLIALDVCMVSADISFDLIMKKWINVGLWFCCLIALFVLLWKANKHMT